MNYLLATTTHPTLGDLILEYMFAPGYMLDVPGFCIVSYIFLSIIISCLIYFYLPKTPYIEDFESIIFRNCLWTRGLSAIAVLWVLTKNNPIIFLSLFFIVAIIEHFLLRSELDKEALITFTLFSAIASATCAYLTYTYGIFCVLTLIICVITWIWLINNDRKAVLEQAWPVVFFIILDFFFHPEY